MNGSVQLRDYLAHRAAGKDRAEAAGLVGMSAEEARLTDIARDKGELGLVEPIDEAPPPVQSPQKERAMGASFTTSISVNGGPEVPIDLAKGIDHPDNADARDVMSEVVRRGLGHNHPPKEKTVAEGTVAADELRLLIERVERLEGEKKAIADDIKDVYLEAKSRGYIPKAMRRLVALRKIEARVREEEAAILDTYASALGMQLSFL